jgi:hypothetical protein
MGEFQKDPSHAEDSKKEDNFSSKQHKHICVTPTFHHKAESIS